MHRKEWKARRFVKSRRATALPVSFLMIFASLTLIVSATYYVSVAKIQARGRLLNISVAQQSMLSFETSIASARWSPGASTLFSFEDSGGTLEVDPSAKTLLVNITDATSFSAIAFNSSIGSAAYQLPAAEVVVSTLYLRGDRRAIINQSAFTMAQLYLSPGDPSPEIVLTHRPLATICKTGSLQGKPVNTLRLYVTSLNTSTALTAQGEFNVKSTCTSVTSHVHTYNFSQPLSSIHVKATLDGRTDLTSLPLSSNANGAFLKVETLLCYIKLERVSGGN